MCGERQSASYPLAEALLEGENPINSSLAENRYQELKGVTQFWEFSPAPVSGLSSSSDNTPRSVPGGMFTVG